MTERGWGWLGLPTGAEVGAAADAITEAMDPTRLRNLVAGAGLGAPVLLATLSDLETATHMRDPEAAMSALAHAQGLSPHGPWARGSRQRFAAVARNMPSLTSFANGSSRFIFVCLRPRMALFRRHPLPMRTAIRLSVDEVVLHEAGHVAEVERGHRQSDSDFAMVPSDLRSETSSHARECYADAHAARGLLQLGWDESVVRTMYINKACFGLEPTARADVAADHYWGRRPLWPAVYFTWGSVAMALRHPRDGSEGMRRAARLGQITGSDFLNLADGDPPSWLGSFDDGEEAIEAATLWSRPARVSAGEEDVIAWLAAQARGATAGEALSRACAAAIALRWRQFASGADIELSLDAREAWRRLVFDLTAALAVSVLPETVRAA